MDRFVELTNLRIGRNRQHMLIDIVVLTVRAVIPAARVDMDADA